MDKYSQCWTDPAGRPGVVAGSGDGGCLPLDCQECQCQ